MEKTKNFNLIILDESGSMSSCVNSTISGCNETLNVIRGLSRQFSDSNDYFVSIYAFQDGCAPSRYLCKNSKIDQQRNITVKDYVPGGMTPMLDAIGSTLVDLEAVAATHDDATGVVTIITDGYENASKEYTYQHVAKIIGRLKEKGWTFNFIGANIDVEEMASKINIDQANCVAFESDEQGTKDIMNRYCRNLERECSIRAKEEEASPQMTMEEKIAYRRNRSEKFFDNFF